jgi:hypothetical protein
MADSEDLDGANLDLERAATEVATGRAGQSSARERLERLLDNEIEFPLQPAGQVVQPDAAPARAKGGQGQSMTQSIRGLDVGLPDGGELLLLRSLRIGRP